MASAETFEFVKKAYALVDDPSTDSVISWRENGRGFTVWHPAECCRNQLPKVLGIDSFQRFQNLGFRKSNFKGLLEFECDDFVRGQPELLANIGKPFWTLSDELLEAADRLKKCEDPQTHRALFKDFRLQLRKERDERAETHFAEQVLDLGESISLQNEQEESLSQDVKLQLKQIIMGV